MCEELAHTITYLYTIHMHVEACLLVSCIGCVMMCYMFYPDVVGGSTAILCKVTCVEAQATSNCWKRSLRCRSVLLGKVADRSFMQKGNFEWGAGLVFSRNSDSMYLEGLCV